MQLNEVLRRINGLEAQIEELHKRLGEKDGGIVPVVSMKINVNTIMAPPEAIETPRLYFRWAMDILRRVHTETVRRSMVNERYEYVQSLGVQGIIYAWRPDCYRHDRWPGERVHFADIMDLNSFIIANREHAADFFMAIRHNDYETYILEHEPPEENPGRRHKRPKLLLKQWKDEFLF